MTNYYIQKSKLEGSVCLSGAKNSALKLLAASLLTSEDVVLSNFPSRLLDVKVHVKMLEKLGKNCISISDDVIKISQEGNISEILLWNERSIRNTLLILGCLLATQRSGKVPLPGGCKLGERKYDIHIMIFEKFGAKVWEEDDYLCVETTDKRLKGVEIQLPMRSTGATENAILCGVLAEGTTRIWNPHIRPEIIDLINFLRHLGAKIQVLGQEVILIEGVDKLSGGKYEVIPDSMEALTWLIGATITKGEVEILNFPFKDLEIPLIHLKESGVKYYSYNDSIIVKGGNCYPIEISTGPYPGINSDMQPLFAIFAACAKGSSKIVDLRFVGRYDYSKEFEKLGIRTLIKDNILNIYGNNNIIGTTVKALDLRAGIALSLGGLVAEGQTIIEDAWQIERGYNNFVKKLKSLNGRIDVQRD